MALAALPIGSPRIDIPGSLRRLADKIEAGKYGDIRFLTALMVRGDQDIAVFSWGNCSDMEAAGAFARASVLCGCATEELEEPE